MDPACRDRLIGWFDGFPSRDTDESPLYRLLAEGVAGDGELLAVAAEAPAGQPVPNLLFAAVHCLLLKGEGEGLRRYYASTGGTERPSAQAVAEFKRFVLDRRARVVQLMCRHRVQTNEVGRCALLLPALATVAAHEDGKPLHLIEVGTSAGLLLGLDRYRYEYSDGTRAGDGPVTLRCEVRDGGRVPVRIPEVAARVGVDLAPVDVRDDDLALWLRALVWPDQPDRARRLESAIELARRQSPFRLVCGDANEALPALIEEAPAGRSPVCVFHCYTLNQFSPDARRRFREILAEGSRNRVVYEIGIEGFQNDSRVILGRYVGGGVENWRHLADNHAHGRWIRWVDRPADGPGEP